MFVPSTFAAALLMVIISAVCWGSWANTYKGTKTYRFELFYWDYTAGIVLMSLVLAFTLGSMHGGPTSFLANVSAADTSNIGWALLAGVIFNVANVLLVAGIDMAGLAVAFPISIGIALVVGVALSYSQQPKGHAGLLAAGVLLALIAVLLNGGAYSQLAAQGKKASKKSLVVCIVSGVLMGSFAPFVARALTVGSALSSYSIGVFFTVGALLCCFVVNVYLMRKPLTGEPVNFGEFFSASPANHLLGLLGGAIWCTGTVFNFVAASLTGVPISYAIGQSAPMVAALWGIFIWKEFAGASPKAKAYLALMFAFFVAAIVVVSQAYRLA
jgi:glucose uptake protein